MKQYVQVVILSFVTCQVPKVNPDMHRHNGALITTSVCSEWREASACRRDGGNHELRSWIRHVVCLTQGLYSSLSLNSVSVTGHGDGRQLHPRGWRVACLPNLRQISNDPAWRERYPGLLLSVYSNATFETYPSYRDIHFNTCIT